MSAAKKLELTPDELFLQEALRDGRCKRMDLSMKALGTPDVSLQARVVHLDMDHVHRLSRAKEAQGSLAPIVVFTDGNVYLLGDGHHRYEVYRKAKEAAISVYVVECAPTAVRREALEYATMCNREMCLGRTQEDVTKAIEMLLEDEVWRGRSDAFIGEHVGCSGNKVTAIRNRLSLKNGWPEPEFVAARDGRMMKYRPCSDPISGGRTISLGTKCRSHGHASINGQTVTGMPEVVAEKVMDIQDKLRDRRRSLSNGAMKSFLPRHGFFGVGQHGRAYVGLRGFYRPGIVCLPCDFSHPEALPTVIGQLVAARQFKEPTARMVVLGYTEDGVKAVIDLYRQAGFEFVTPEELVESLKG